MKTCLRIVPLVLVLCGCGGGGSAPPDGSGGGSGGEGPDVFEEQSYSVADFDYHDPRPASFQPMGGESSLLARRDELMIANVPEDPTTARATLFDDIGAGAPVLGEVADLLGAGAYRAGASGNLDDDADEELAMVRIAGGSLQVSIIQRTPAGAYAGEPAFTVPSSGFTYREARLTLGDVDGDHRDEFLLVAREWDTGTDAQGVWLRIYDDPLDGYTLLREVDLPLLDLSKHNQDLQAVPVDLDGDGRAEVALLSQARDASIGAAVSVSVRVLDDAQADFEEIVPWFKFEDNLDFFNTGSRLLAGDFDGDAQAEVAVAVWNASLGGFTGAKLQSFRLDGASLVGSLRWSFTSSGGSGQLIFRANRAFDAVSMDRDGDGTDEIAILLPQPALVLPSRLAVLRRDGDAWRDAASVDMPYDMADAASMVATDDDADGQDELYFCRMSGSSGSSTKGRLALRIDFGAVGGPITNSWTSTAQSAGWVYPPALVAGDFDADGLAIRYTGRKFTSLSDPMPLVVLSVAPTKAGISQNHAGTSTTYRVTRGSSETFGVSSSVTVSAYEAVSIPGLFGLFDVTARETITHSLRTSETQTVRKSLVQGFSAPHDADAVVFQGTLYQSYEYEIVAAPDASLVGTLFTLDIPVASRVYKWSVGYYNSKVDSRLRIGLDVLSHTVGDPASYPGRAELETLTAPYVHWDTDDNPPMSVGQGGAANSLTIELAEEFATAEERTFGVNWEAGFSAGGLAFGGSFGVTDWVAYTVTVSQLASYEGVVGDISAVEDYEGWRYEFGLAVYHRGLLADTSNRPVGQEPGVLPYQVIRFWTNPTGTEY